MDQDHEQFLTEWANIYTGNQSLNPHSHPFNKDGIVNQEMWALRGRSQRCLFLLKETNEYPGDVRELQPWKRLGVWSYVFSHSDAGELPSFSVAETPTEWTKAFKESAWINLRKLSGKGQAQMQPIREFVFEHSGNRDRLRQQVLWHIKPGVVICGGRDVYEVATQLFDFGAGQPKGPDWCVHNGIVWISFFHPSARLCEKTAFYALARLYRDALLASGAPSVAE